MIYLLNNMKGLFGGYVNLLKTIIGSGILSLPGLFVVYGVFFTFFFILFSAFLAGVGLNIYILCSKKCDRPVSLSSLLSDGVPKLRSLVELSVLIKCIGVCITYLIIIKQLLPRVTLRYTKNISVITQLGILVILIAPLCYFKKIDNLKHTSFCGLIAILFLVIVSIYRLIKNMIIETRIININSVLKTPNINWITNIGKFIFAFTCHQNMFTVQNEIEDNSTQKMNKLVLCVINSAMVIYCLFGFSTYLLFGNKITDNILEIYPNDILTTIVYISYILVMAFSYPLQINPCRIYALNLFRIKFKTEIIGRFIITSILIIITYGVAISGIRLGTVYSIIGATASNIICFIVPPIIYCNMDIRRTRKYKCLAILLFTVGIFIFLITIFNFLIKYFL